MSSSNTESCDEGEASSLSYYSTQDLSHVQTKQEILSCINFLFKILYPDSINIFSKDIVNKSLPSLIQTAFSLSENALDLVTIGKTQKSFSLSLKANMKISEEINVSLMPKNVVKDVLGKLLRCDKKGVYLSSQESKSLISLILGGLRDCSVTEMLKNEKILKKKIKNKTRRAEILKKQNIELDLCVEKEFEEKKMLENE